MPRTSTGPGRSAPRGWPVLVISGRGSPRRHAAGAGPGGTNTSRRRCRRGRVRDRRRIAAVARRPSGARPVVHRRCCHDAATCWTARPVRHRCVRRSVAQSVRAAARGRRRGSAPPRRAAPSGTRCHRPRRTAKRRDRREAADRVAGRSVPSGDGDGARGAVGPGCRGGSATWLVAAAFLVTMLGTTLPTPLYPLYERELGFGGLMVTVVFATYAVGVLAALLLVGRLSDQVGRKAVLLPGLGVAAASSLVFLIPDSLAALFAGRLLSGVSAGVFTGVATATIVDLAPPTGRARAGLLAAVVNVLGLGLGPVLAGVLADHAPVSAGAALRGPRRAGRRGRRRARRRARARAAPSGAGAVAGAADRRARRGAADVRARRRGRVRRVRRARVLHRGVAAVPRAGAARDPAPRHRAGGLRRAGQRDGRAARCRPG